MTAQYSEPVTRCRTCGSTEQSPDMRRGARSDCEPCSHYFLHHGVAPAITLAPDEQVELQAAAQDTWDAIAYDILSGCEPGDTLTRDDVIAFVLDADHILTYAPHLSRRIRRYLRHGDHEGIYSLLRQAFTDAHYGM